MKGQFNPSWYLVTTLDRRSDRKSRKTKYPYVVNYYTGKKHFNPFEDDENRSIAFPTKYQREQYIKKLRKRGIKKISRYKISAMS
jgi:hypothetical protein